MKRYSNSQSIGISAVLASTMLVTGVVEAKSWTCDATVNLQGVTPGVSYTIPDWGMNSRKWFPDREQECKNYLTSNWLDNGAIRKYLAITPQQEKQICQAGKVAVVRVEYGHDGRKKSWSFTRSIPTPSCVCPKICLDDWLLDATNLCAKQVSACGPVDLSPEIFLAEDDKHGLYVRDNYIYQWQSPTVDTSNCVFKTPW
jgi:hypothetical protein